VEISTTWDEYTAACEVFKQCQHQDAVCRATQL